jgi:hypothetical protein
MIGGPFALAEPLRLENVEKFLLFSTVNLEIPETKW